MTCRRYVNRWLGHGWYVWDVTAAKSGLPGELRQLIESGPLVHLSTVSPDGSPQVSVIWVGLDGDDLVSGHMSRYAKVRNIERDPRVVLSFTAPRDRAARPRRVPESVRGAAGKGNGSSRRWCMGPAGPAGQGLHVSGREVPGT